MKKGLTFILVVLSTILVAQEFAPIAVELTNDNITNISYYEFLDLDGDGDKDFIAGDDMTFYLNDGSGVYTEGLVFSEPFRATGDFNGDGLLDLIGEGNAWINNGDETYTEVPLDFEEAEYYVADFNNDGNDDFLIYEKFEFDVRIRFGSSDGTFTSSGPSVLNTSFNLGNIVVADFNDDGFLDFAQADLSDVEVFLNDGDGTFSVNTSDISGATRFLKSGDLDNDGDLDIVWSKGLEKIGWALNDGTGAFTDTGEKQVGHAVRGLDLTDFNNDGYPDIVIAGIDVLSSSKMRYYSNNKQGDFNDGPFLMTLPDSWSGAFFQEGTHNRFQAFDIGEDGDTDLFVLINNEIIFIENLVPTNLVSFELDTSFEVFPNPFQDYLQINSPDLEGEKIIIEIYNNLGQLVKKEKGHMPLFFDKLNGLKQGIYFTQIKIEVDGKLIATGKVIKD